MNILKRAITPFDIFIAITFSVNFILTLMEFKAPSMAIRECLWQNICLSIIAYSITFRRLNPESKLATRKISLVSYWIHRNQLKPHFLKFGGILFSCMFISFVINSTFNFGTFKACIGGVFQTYILYTLFLHYKLKEDILDLLPPQKSPITLRLVDL